MNPFTLIAQEYFDGATRHSDGPYEIEIRDGRISRISSASREAEPPREAIQAGFVMPGLVEAHAHLFLDGAELDLEARRRYLKAPLEEMLEVGRRNACRSLAAGITLIRDAGDIHGVNTRLKAEFQSNPVGPEILSAGKAIRNKGRYGSFMAVEANGPASLAEIVRRLAAHADQLKILLTGIIDFERGEMRGGAQFSLDEARILVQAAHDSGKLTFAHCSGAEGLRIATAVGIDSIEHGFFMSEDILEVMRRKRIAWVPTFSPVYFQYAHPRFAGWSESVAARLKTILENHLQHLKSASDGGVPIVAGSDAGSYGVPHGRGLIDELLFEHQAGISMEKVLASATSVPRSLWRLESADIRIGNKARLALFEKSPFEDPRNLLRVSGVLAGNQFITAADASRGVDSGQCSLSAIPVNSIQTL